MKIGSIKAREIASKNLRLIKENIGLLVWVFNVLITQIIHPQNLLDILHLNFHIKEITSGFLKKKNLANIMWMKSL